MNADDDKVTAAGIARRVGIGRAAVSNWRKRYDEFPQPTEGYFSWSEVLDWLTVTGKAGQLAAIGQTDTGTRRIDGVAPQTIGGHPVVEPTGRRRPASPEALLARSVAALLPLPEDVDPSGRGDRPDADDLPVVVDPACGDGSFLAAVGDRFGDHVLLVGRDTDEAATSATVRRLRDHPDDLRHDIHAGGPDNPPTLYTGAAAAVVCGAPTSGRSLSAPTSDARRGAGAPATPDPDMAWVLHCMSLLRPRGVAVVSMFPAAATRTSGRDVRTGLVRSGVLRDVIVLPAEAGGPTASVVHLWVLQRPPVDDAPVRMADLSSTAVAEDLPADHGQWEQVLSEPVAGTVGAVGRLDVLDGETSLLPARYLGPADAPAANELGELVARVRAGYARIGDAFPSPVESPARRERPTVTVAELERSGALRVRARGASPRRGDVLVRPLGRPPVVATGTPDEENGLAQVIEIDVTWLDAHVVALFLHADVAAAPAGNTHSAISRDDLRRCRIPRMSPSEQRRYGDAIRHVLDLQDALTALENVGRGVLDQTLHGLTTGDLLPAPITRRETIVAEPNESEIS